MQILSYGRQEMGLFDITVDYNRVRIGGMAVDRPETISPSQWLDLWEAVESFEAYQSTIEQLEEQLNALQDENEDLRRDRERLRDEVLQLERALARHDD